MVDNFSLCLAVRILALKAETMPYLSLSSLHLAWRLVYSKRSIKVSKSGNL